MFKLNILNISIWVLGGILVLILIGTLIWRLLTPNDKNYRKSANIKVDNSIKDISLSLANVYDITLAVNILFKNRFSKKKYSAIPIISTNKNNNIFLIANPINFNSKHLYKKELNGDIKKVSKKNDEKTLFEMSRYKDITKYLMSINISSNILIPYSGVSTVGNKNMVEIKNIGEYINSINENNNNEPVKLFKKLSKVNLYKSKSLKGGKNV